MTQLHPVIIADERSIIWHSDLSNFPNGLKVLKNIEKIEFLAECRLRVENEK